MIPEKRRSSARIKAETPSKKQAVADTKKATPAKETPPKTARGRKSSQAKTQTPVQEPPPEEEPEEVEPEQHPLPVKVSDGEPLPTVENHQIADPSVLKSVAESGVLAAALQRSRTRWLTEGLFEKYWTKPSKKKGQPELTNNPAKDSMSKLGQCRVYIDPHVFDVTLFSIKDPNAPPKSSIKAAVQHAPSPNGSSQSPSVAVSAPQYQGSPAPAYSPPVASTPPSQQPAPPQPTAQRPQDTATSQSPHSAPQQSPPQQQPVQPTTQTHPAATTTTSNTPASTSSQPIKPSQDPVIQMLAQRASTSPELKILMKIVASGNASHEQLKIFQSHIDDLTSILQRQKQAENASAATSYATNPQHSSNSPPAPSVNRFPPVQSMSPLPAANVPPVHAQGYYAIPQSKTKSYASKPDVPGIVMEFAAGSSDRFLLPKNSMLEYLPTQKTMIISFLIVRKGGTLESDRYQNEKEYYEPVTVRIVSDQPKVMETISRAAAPYDEARKYMEETMARATRANSVHLALNLPRDDNDENGNTTVADMPGRPFIEAKPTKGMRNRQLENWDLHCQFCYVLLSASQIKSTKGGERACQACAALMKNPLPVRSVKSGKKNAHVAQPQTSGPLALML